MSFAKSGARTRPLGIEFEEARAWVGFYQRVGSDPAIAAEVMAQLESDLDMKRMHLALYLCCRESLRRHKARQARNKRIGQWVRWLCHGLFVRPLLRLRNGLRQAGDLAVECLPETMKEPAVPQVRRLGQQAEFATAQATFEQQSNRSAVSPDDASATACPKVPHTGT